MGNLTKRIQSFIGRSIWLGHYMSGGSVQAAFHLVRTKLSSKILGRATYFTLPFIFATQDMSAIKEVLEDREYQFLDDVIKDTPSPVILDAGAHIGLFALWSLHVNSKAQVLSLEASPGTYLRTKANSDMARRQGYTWNVIHAAAWKEPGFVCLDTGGDTMGHHVSTAEGNVRVPTITLGGLFERLKQDFGSDIVDILKVDIEGAEEAFIVAGAPFLSHVKNVVIELHPNRCDVSRVREILGKSFRNIVPCMQRESNKPLLHCYN